MITIGDRRVGDGAPCFITFEAGPTHHGVESAKRLVTLASEAGADAVKFQMSDPDRLIADRSVTFSYDVLVDRETGETETVTEPLYDIIKRRYLTYDEWKEVKRHADGLGMALFFTAGFDDLVDVVADLGCASLKIASADVNHFPLLRKAARTGLCIQLDSGNATMGEVERAVDVVLGEGNPNVVIHNCPSGYPARLPSINLRFIRTLKDAFGLPVAFSDHTPGWEMDVAAVAMGANMVEKTITEDRTTRSVEHYFSLEPQDMNNFVRTIRDVETALGSARRTLAPAEIENRRKIRRSAYLASPAKAGQRVAEADVIYQRPGFGIGPDVFETLGDLRLARDLDAGHMLTFADLG